VACRGDYPHERSLVARYQGRPFALLGVNSDTDRNHALRVVAARGINWRNWWDVSSDGPIATTWQVEAFPTVYVLDGRGVIRFAHVRGPALDQAVESLLRETP
jgi:hypothetical protein